MYKLSITLLLTILVSCDYNKPNRVKCEAVDTPITKIVNSENESIYDKLQYHFNSYRIKPSIIINNTEGNQTEILLAKHIIKWFNTEDETKIKIDNDLFSLKDKVTLNVVWNDRDSVDFANNWDEIKLFNHKDKEYISIRMSFDPCTGLGCSVSYYLIYDVETKSKNFFGTFINDNNLELFDFSNDDKVDYVSKTFRGDAHGSTPMEFIYELYSIDIKGQFREQKNSNGLTYQIKHTTFPNDTTKTDEISEHWIMKLK